MSNHQETQYVGKGKQVYGKGLINFSICLEDILGNIEITEEARALLDLFSERAKNGKHYVNCTMGTLKQPNQWGDTHSVWLNTWKPNQQQGTSSRTVHEPIPNEDIRPEDIPF